MRDEQESIHFTARIILTVPRCVSFYIDGLRLGNGPVTITEK
jgi:hypothetical protein